MDEDVLNEWLMVFMLSIGLSPSASKESSQDWLRSGHFGFPPSSLLAEVGTRLVTSHVAQVKQIMNVFTEN